MKPEKMDNSMRVRIQSDLQTRFADVLTKEGKGRTQSETLRELMEAAIRYYERTGDLYPPYDLIPGRRGGDAVPTLTVHQVHNGKGHQKSVIKKG